jgi:simple sugar transport system permease protein
VTPAAIGSVAAAALRIATPLAYGAVGGVLCERAGTVNIALEGEILAGAFAATVAATIGGAGAGGAVAAAVGAGALVGLLHAALTAGLRVDHVVSGVALNLLVSGATKFALPLLYGQASNSRSFDAPLPALRLPDALGGAAIDALTIGALGAAALAAVLLGRTVLGLRLRAAGEAPFAAAAAGLSPARLRAIAAVLGGAVAALGGAWLALDQHQFVADMSGGRGYMALAAVILGRWRPLAALGAALLFAGADAVEIALQAAGIAVPSGLLHALPYAVAMGALATAAGRARPPRALGERLSPVR